MNIYKSITYQQDLLRTLSSLDVSSLKQSSILITGATGLIGSALVDLLLYFNKATGADIKIYAASRSLEKIHSRFGDFGIDYGLIPVAYDALQDISFRFKANYIVHAASNATPDAYVAQPVDTMLSNVKGIYQLLQYASIVQAHKVIYVSSSEVYGTLPSSEPLREDQYGYINPLLPRSSYPMGKKAAENLCIGYAKQYDCNVSIVRPGHIYGPTSAPNDQRVSSAFARLAAQRQDIIMKSPGTQRRSYCYCLDCASAILTVLLNGSSGEAYNISNPDSIITIYEMASLLAKHGQVALKMELPSSWERAAFNPMDNSSLDSSKLESLGWQGLFNASTGLAHTISILREIQE